MVANDVVFDVLMYLTPEFSQKVLECVTTQISDLHLGFKKVHDIDDINCSIIGHSLGSVIAWDILSILKDNQEDHLTGDGSETDPVHCDAKSNIFSLPVSNYKSPTGYQVYAQESGDENVCKVGTWGPSLPEKMKTKIPFTPEFVFFLGSPLGLFLTLRGAHPVFDEIRNVSESSDSHKTGPSPFTLPSGAIYNIFHPSDPVAYRIEPLLFPQNTDESEIPHPSFLAPDGGLRLHVKAKELGDSLRKGFSDFFRAPISKLPKKSIVAEYLEGSEETQKNKKHKQASNKFPLGGKSDRIDYQLQTRIVDNEYLSALSAHTCYFENSDIIDFLIQCVRET